MAKSQSQRFQIAIKVLAIWNRRALRKTAAESPLNLFQESPRQTKPKKGQFMNFSRGQTGTKVRCESRLFPKEKHQNSQKNGEIHELFVLALSLVWLAGAAPDCWHIISVEIATDIPANSNRNDLKSLAGLGRSQGEATQRTGYEGTS